MGTKEWKMKNDMNGKIRKYVHQNGKKKENKENSWEKAGTNEWKSGKYDQRKGRKKGQIKIKENLKQFPRIIKFPLQMNKERSDIHHVW